MQCGHHGLIRTGQAVVGFIESPHLPPDLSNAAVQDDDMVLVVAPEDPWARRRTPVTAVELAATALVTREHGSGTRYALEHLLTTSGPAPGIAAGRTIDDGGRPLRHHAGTALRVLSALVGIFVSSSGV
ncbi:MAG: LysR substrate-binding domain-containing protein [Pseudarthrobacter sp.]